MGHLLTYSGITTKVHAMQAKLLTRSNYEEIASLHTVSEVVSYLKDNTAYHDLLDDIDEAHMHRGDIEKLLFSSLYSDYQKLYRFAGESQRKLLKLYLKRYEIDLINYCFRIVFNHYEQPFDLHYTKTFFDKYSQISTENLLAANNMNDLIEGLHETEYYPTLARLRDEGASTLYDYDLALNLYYFSSLWKSQKKVLRGKELEQFVSVCGTEIDLLNLQWIYRGKKYYNMEPAELYALVIPVHYKIPRELFQELVDSPTLEEFITLLKRTFYGRKYDFEQKFTLERIYNTLLYHLYLRDQRKNPYSVTSVTSYLFLKEHELKTLTTALECIRYSLPASETLNYLGGIRK